MTILVYVVEIFRKSKLIPVFICYESPGIIPVSCEELFKGIEERKLTDDVEREAEYQVGSESLGPNYPHAYL